MMIRQQMVCVLWVNGSQTGRTEANKEAFREEVERLASLSDGQTMLCVVGDFNVQIGVFEPGDEGSIGTFGWGTSNREERELVEMLKRNGLAVAGTFFQKKDSHNITYRSGRHKTELDLLVVRQQQLRKVKDCKGWRESISPHSTNRSSLRSAWRNGRRRGKWDQRILSGGSARMI